MITKVEQQAAFDKMMHGLNPAQKKAVDNMEGPVMVIAGPGTGKTQILGARIGKILLETDTRPENILCLTYTDAGVVAMRKRLLDFIGPDAYKVNLYTFHAFCNDIIQENLSLFEKTSLDPISDLEKIALFKKLIDEFPKNHPLKRYRGDVYFEINNLQHLFSTMKKEGWTPDYIDSCIDAYIADIPNREAFVYKRAYKGFKAGDLKENKVEEAKEKMEKLRAAVAAFPVFKQIMRTKNRYDFDDMINWVIRAFDEDKYLLVRYQEQYQYILVDEYQDTSGTQNKLVEQLISFWDTPNIFVVGDDDQSIYRFQGANIENMQAFAEKFSDSLLTVVLTNNYRSTQAILDVSKTLIDKNEERLVKKIEGLSKDLVASNANLAPLTHKPVIQVYESPRGEMIGITNAVEALISSGTAPGQIAVIYKENKYGEELATYFKEKSIPYFSKRNVNILHQPTPQKLIKLLTYLAAEHDIPYGGDALLFEILHFDWFQIPPIEIAKLSAAVADRRFGDNKTSLRRLIAEKLSGQGEDLFTKEIPGLQAAATFIEKIISDVPNKTLQTVFENCIKESGLLRCIMESLDKHWELKLLTGLFDFIKEETRRNPRLTLDALVTIFSLMNKEGLVLPLAKISGSSTAVNLLTAHGSKGLEFEYVFFVGCNASNWEKKKKPGGGYQLPDTIFVSGPAHKEEEELRRLFYVALTRAAQYLTISYTQYKNDGKEIEPSLFVAEIIDGYGLVPTKINITEETLSAFALIGFSKEQAPEIEKEEADFVHTLLDKFVMNVTALNNYLKCPLQFYYNNLVRVPSGKSEATEFGSAVHFALEMLFQKMQKNNNIFQSKELFIADFNWYMHRHRENFTKEQFDRKIEYGEIVLTNYYDANINSWNKVMLAETNIRNVVIKGVPLKGKLDKIEFDGKNVNVVDYKTGDIDKARPKLKPPHDKDPNGGDYWRQAVFYKILIDNYPSKDWEAISATFDFIEPDKQGVYKQEKVVVTPGDIATVTHQIETVWQKIKNKEFYTGCGKNECHWCNFVKTNKISIALHALNEEQDESGD